MCQKINSWFDGHPHIRQFVINLSATLIGGYLAIIWAGPQLPPQPKAEFSSIPKGSEVKISNSGIMNFSGAFKVVSEDTAVPIGNVDIKSGQIFSSVIAKPGSDEKYIAVRDLPKSRDVVLVIDGPQRVSLQPVSGDQLRIMGGDTQYVAANADVGRKRKDFIE